ncbi:PREDICTED: uncharacterized protein LOC106817335 [Priapulus caudatus]|uniref:Uncharacterized protein LOC106817335 n=1 Tax=Priapulus caudatus TaxID=37621 RepID=A0ABM1EZ60_PRICU|nr:PREDICTED: uncharacterized protein LOC106817335 [Priapulus caudatus]
MCYVCGRAILGYEHFGAHCSLFDACWDEVAMVPQQPQEAIMIQIQLNEYPDAWRRLVTCMRCKQRCLRADDRNNHLRCWSCKVNQCLDCKTVIIGPVGAHFRPPSTCKQHS